MRPPVTPITRTPVQEALVRLRSKLNYSQQQMAEALEVAMVSVCRWETRRPPGGGSVAMLMRFARDAKFEDEAQVFEAALNGARKPGLLGRLISRPRFDEILERLARIEDKLDRLERKK